VEIALRGVAIGFAIASPVGPIGTLCVRRTLAFGLRNGIATGLGAATADATYAALAAAGISAATALTARIALPLHVVGALALAYLALTIVRRRPAERDAELRPASDLVAFATTFVLTLCNPATILSFAAVVAATALGRHALALGAGVAFVAGVWVGSALWWLILSGTIARVRHRLGSRAMRRIDYASGAVLLGFAIVALV
jgi:threonine/homoserine/homoserine lactone efflux protein